MLSARLHVHTTCVCGILRHRSLCLTPSAAQCINLALAAACVLQGTFSDLSALLEEALQRPSEGVADGILLDLGMSSMQAGTLWPGPCKSAVLPDLALQPGEEARQMLYLVCSVRSSSPGMPVISLWVLPSSCTAS